MISSEEFARIFDEQVRLCSETLFKKAGEYATDDNRLHNFDIAGYLQGQVPAQALGGMMAKHTISIYDMIDLADERDYPMALWDEKLTDHINYLILLRACVVDMKKELTTTGDVTYADGTRTETDYSEVRASYDEKDNPQ